jgi:NAD(P)-dependent dehydrogenase (short-subunit alcohol dehydrogenase family)
MRVVVVGASSGLGRCIGVGLAERGAQVALLARRADRLQDAVEEVGSGAVAVPCDVTDEPSCRAAVADAATRLGGIDGLVYATGIGVMKSLVDMDAATWAHMFATNVTGAALVTAAAVPHLERARGAAVYLSSISASLTPPWPMLGAYATSKAALDKLVEAWQGEHPDVGFTRLAVGDSGGGAGASATEFHASFDNDLLVEFVDVWMSRGYMNGGLIPSDDLVTVVESVLRCGSTSTIPSVTLSPRAPQTRTPPAPGTEAT